MFYVSDITGAQKPYSAEFFQALRLERAAELQSASNASDAAEADAAGAYRHLDQAQSSLAASTTPSHTTGDSGASAVAAGVAGSPALHGKSEQGVAGKVDPQDQKLPRKRQVSEVRQAQSVDEDGDEATIHERVSTPAQNPYEKLDRPIPKREKATYAEQIMSDTVVTLRDTDTVGIAWKLFRDRRFRHVPVLSNDDRLVGLLSDRDFLKFSTQSLRADGEPLERSDVAIKNIMTRNVLTARPETEIRLIANIMFQERIGAMPIVNEEEELVGILTRSDILRILVNKAPLELWV